PGGLLRSRVVRHDSWVLLVAGHDRELRRAAIQRVHGRPDGKLPPGLHRDGAGGHGGSGLLLSRQTPCIPTTCRTSPGFTCRACTQREEKRLSRTSAAELPVGGPTVELAEFLSSTTLGDIPESVVDRSNHLL